MKPETKKEVKDTISTLLLCALSVAVVTHLHGVFGADASKTSDVKNIQQKLHTDSIKTDTVPTANFVREQMMQQKTR